MKTFQIVVFAEGSVSFICGVYFVCAGFRIRKTGWWCSVLRYRIIQYFMLGIAVLSKAHRERYTGSIGAFDYLTFWEDGQILSATTLDDVAWTAQRLLNQGHLSAAFSQALSLDQPLSFRCFPQVPAVVLRRAVVDRMHQNLFVFAMLKAHSWRYQGHTARLKVLRDVDMEMVLQDLTTQSQDLGPLYWQAPKLWVRFLMPLPSWVSHPSATQPIRQLILDAPFEELTLFAQIREWEKKGAVQVSDSPAHISAELTEEDKLIFKDHDRYRGPQKIVQRQAIVKEEEEIALGEEYPSENSMCIDEANQILKDLSGEEINHSMLVKTRQGYRLELPSELQAGDMAQLTHGIHRLFQSIKSQYPKALRHPDLLRWERRWLS